MNATRNGTASKAALGKPLGSWSWLTGFPECVGTTNQRNQLENLWMTVTYLESVVWNVGSRQRDRRENL